MLQHFRHSIANKRSDRCGLGGFLIFSPCMQEAPRLFEATAYTRPEVVDSSHDGAGVNHASVGAPKMLEIQTQELVNHARAMEDHLWPLGFEPISKPLASNTVSRSSDERHWQVFQRAELFLDFRRRGLFTSLRGQSPSFTLRTFRVLKPATVASNLLFGNFLRGVPSLEVEGESESGAISSLRTRRWPWLAQRAPTIEVLD